MFDFFFFRVPAVHHRDSRTARHRVKADILLIDLLKRFPGFLQPLPVTLNLAVLHRDMADRILVDRSKLQQLLAGRLDRFSYPLSQTHTA